MDTNEIVNLDKNADLNQALNEFQQKSQLEELQKAPKVEKNSELPMMVRWVMKLSGGAIKEQRQAEYVLLCFIIVMVVLTFYFFFKK